MMSNIQTGEGREGEGGTYPPALPESHKGTMWEGGWSVDGGDGIPLIPGRQPADPILSNANLNIHS